MTCLLPDGTFFSTWVSDAYPDPGAVTIDVFAIDWLSKGSYELPRVILTSLTLQKIEMDEAYVIFSVPC